MQAKIKYTFTAKLWQSNEPGAWVFVSLPVDISKEIRQNLKWQEEGWGRMKVSAVMREIEWDTAIWFDTKSNVYLLPVKAIIRKKAKLELNQEYSVTILI